MKKNALLISVILLAAFAAARAAVPADTLTPLQQTLPYNDQLPQTFPDFTYQPASCGKNTTWIPLQDREQIPAGLSVCWTGSTARCRMAMCVTCRC